MSLYYLCNHDQVTIMQYTVRNCNSQETHWLNLLCTKNSLEKLCYVRSACEKLVGIYWGYQRVLAKSLTQATKSSWTVGMTMLRIPVGIIPLYSQSISQRNSVLPSGRGFTTVPVGPFSALKCQSGRKYFVFIESWGFFSRFWQFLLISYFSQSWV